VTTPPAYPVYPVDAIAKLLNLTPRRIRQLVAEGIIPRVERGKYDLIRSVRGYVKYLQERAEGRGVEPSGLHEERMRLLTAQAEHKELEVARCTGRSSLSMRSWPRGNSSRPRSAPGASQYPRS
jgi:phage terminase Nu1 subunit (DNA packaging protein)